MKYNTVLLDLDDTLVVEEESARRSFLAAADYVKRLHGIDTEHFMGTVRSAAKELWYSLPTIGYALAIGISSWEALWADFSDTDDNQRELLKHKGYYRTKVWSDALGAFGIKDENLASTLSSIFIEDRRSRHVPFDDTAAFLNRLADLHVKTGLVTNGTPDLQWQKIKKSGVEKYFGAIVISGELGCRKPAGEMFLRCLERLGATIEGAVMIGDTLESDVKGANDAGIVSVWLNRKGKRNTTDIRPAYEMKNLHEVMELLR